MHDELPLLINIAVSLVAAFLGGVIARRIGLPTIVGYMLAGIAIGPFTPGFVGDAGTASQLAELGVVFLMFGVGVHFSLGDLWRAFTPSRNVCSLTRLPLGVSYPVDMNSLPGPPHCEISNATRIQGENVGSDQSAARGKFA